VAFQFRKASCVVVGTFNIYILHPQWLTKHGIVAEGTELAIETNLSQPGFRFQFPNSRSTWSIAPVRIGVESQDPDMDCGRVVASILRALPETPLLALGNNVVYQADLGELATLSAAIRDFPRNQRADEGEMVVQRTFHAGVKHGENATFNLQLSLTADSVELVCNVHTALESLADANAAAVAAAEQFIENRRRSRTLAQHFFGASIHDDSNHS